MEKVTYIIPIHYYNEEVEKYLTTALQSVKEMVGAESYEVMFVAGEDVLAKCEALYKQIGCPQKLTKLVSEDNFFVKINKAAMKCVTPYFSVLEFDDSYYPYYDKVVQKYLSKSRYSVIIPITEMVQTDGNIPALCNEISWDKAFADELGFVSFEELKTYKAYNVTGAYIKTNDFLSLGGLKPELEIAAWYEYLLNVVENKHQIYVIPRVGYKHTIMREGSYMVQCQTNISQEEGGKLIEKADEMHPIKDENQEPQQQ